MGTKKAKDCHRHAIKRARERYQEFFTYDEIEKMGQLIRQANKPGQTRVKHLFTESHTRTHWLVDDKYIVVYNKALQAVTTFLPPESIYAYLGRPA